MYVLLEKILSNVDNLNIFIALKVTLKNTM